VGEGVFAGEPGCDPSHRGWAGGGGVARLGVYVERRIPRNVFRTIGKILPKREAELV